MTFLLSSGLRLMDTLSSGPSFSTYTPPSGWQFIIAHLFAGGGGGGGGTGGTTGQGGGGGGGGGYACHLLHASMFTQGSALSWNVGAGGTGGYGTASYLGQSGPGQMGITTYIGSGKIYFAAHPGEGGMPGGSTAPTALAAPAYGAGGSSPTPPGMSPFLVTEAVMVGGFSGWTVGIPAFRGQGHGGSSNLNYGRNEGYIGTTGGGGGGSGGNAGGATVGYAGGNCVGPNMGNALGLTTYSSISYTRRGSGGGGAGGSGSVGTAGTNGAGGGGGSGTTTNPYAGGAGSAADASGALQSSWYPAGGGGGGGAGNTGGSSGGNGGGGYMKLLVYG